MERWKPYLKASLINGFAPFLSKPFVDAEFDFYRRTLRGVKENQPRWKRAVNGLNANMGEMLGQAVRRPSTSSPRPRRGWSSWSRTCARRIAGSIDGLEWMGPETKKQAQEKLAKFRPKVGYPNKWRDYSKLEIKRDDLVGNLLARLRLRERISARQSRQARRSRAVGHDAADRQRLLQPGAQRDRLPRRDPPAAVLRHGRRRCRQLRRHRRRDRPRDGPRLRRSGPELRRARACSATGGRKQDADEYQKRAKLHRRAVQPARTAAGTEGERRAHARREHRRPDRRWSSRIAPTRFRSRASRRRHSTASPAISASTWAGRRPGPARCATTPGGSR